MDALTCSLQALIACFSWSNFYLDGGLIYDDMNYVEISPITLEIASAPRDPFGRLALGYEMRFERLTFSISAAHVSSLRTDQDRGKNSIQLNARWYPFRR